MFTFGNYFQIRRNSISGPGGATPEIYPSLISETITLGDFDAEDKNRKMTSKDSMEVEHSQLKKKIQLNEKDDLQ